MDETPPFIGFLSPHMRRTPSLQKDAEGACATSVDAGGASDPPPPQQKLSIFPLENRATAHSPGRPSPHHGGHWLIVIFLRLATGWSDQIHPPGRNLMMP